MNGPLAAVARPWCPSPGHNAHTQTLASHADPPLEPQDDLIDFDPAERPIGYNPLQADPARRYLVASGLVSAFRKVWWDSWGPRLEHILRFGLLTLAEFPGSSLIDLPRLLTDAAFRRGVAARVKDQQVQEFWQTEFQRYGVNFPERGGGPDPEQDRRLPREPGDPERRRTAGRSA